LVERAALGTGAVVAAVVGVVVFLAAAALVEAAAELGRAAREDAPEGPVVGCVELAAMRLSVVCPVLVQEVCEVKGHRSF